QRWPSPKVPP
uniref:Bradykinin-potentiating peptide 10f n=1 Tax=Bothrops fonsecai TaxID=157549 RepID=BPPAF_BOTFO|nr:RecName: Full=Bradykinin-potentiating peptide 10f; Short=BPP-10f [Bothrops fonsecai]